MKSAQVQQFKRKLESQREEAFRLLHRMGDESRTMDTDVPQDSGDLSTSTVSKEFLFQQSSQRRRTVRRIEAALGRIEDGTFGVCVECGEDIAPRRLEALPWSDLCLHCQERREQLGIVGVRSDADEMREHA